MLSTLRTDAGLVTQVLTGNSTPFEELVRRHFNMVYGIAFSYTRNHADAEGLSQDAFVKAYQRLDSLEDKRKFGHWVSVITRNLARTWFVRRQREVEVLKDAHEATPAKNDAVYDDMREVLEQQINELDPIPREVLMLHYFSGHSTAEIAKAMDVSQVAVLKRLQRAREALGVKLIHELKVIPPIEHDANQRRRKIMSSITASGITWNLGGGWTSVAASTMLSGKALVTGVLSVGVIATMIAVSPTPEPPSSTTENGSSLAIPLALNEQDMERVAESIDTLSASSKEGASLESPVILAAAQLPEEPTETANSINAEEKGSESLEGSWRLFIGEAGKDDDNYQGYGAVTLVRSGTTLKIDHGDMLEAIALEGDVVGLKVNLNIYNKETEGERPLYGSLKGAFNEDFTVLTLKGGVDIDSDGLNEQELFVRIEKLSHEENEAEVALLKAQETLKALHQALIAYMRKYKTSPTALKRDYADTKEKVLALDDGERIIYTRIAYEELDFQPPMGFSDLESWKNFEATKDPSYLLDLEKELAALWGGNFPGAHKLILLRNEIYDFELRINKDGRITVEKSPEIGDPTAERTKSAQLRTSCQNNMKQIGLVFKMYANESYNEHIPGGFRQTYPEYLNDLNILTCPGKQHGRVGYLILYPASREDYCRELYEKIVGAAPELSPLYLSAVPWVIEKEDCSQSGGRNVLYADGHVEFIKDQDWAARMHPYLKYAYE